VYYSLLAIGDSYTIGEGVERHDSWPARLTSMLRAEGFQLGEPRIVARTGWKTAEIRVALEGEEGEWAIASVLAGVNDQYDGVPARDYEREMRLLLDRAVERTGDDPQRIVVVSIPDWGVTPFGRERARERIADEIDAFNEVNRELASAAGMSYVDVTPASRLRQAADEVVGDGLHPSAAVYVRWAEMVLPLARAIVRRTSS
jgi:lysophospholipase L1-like esterase